MSEQYTESDLKSLTVVKLKELLADRSLPVTGRKDDLISRLLSSSTSSPTSAGQATTTLPPPTTDTTGPASSTDEPDGAGLSGTAEVSAAANTETDRSAAEKDEGLKTAPPAPPVPEVSEEQKRALLAAQAKDEEERRRKRAERFGLSAIQGEKGDESEEVKRKRAERFGLQNAGEVEEKGAEVDKKMGKSLEALSSALGSSRARKSATSKSAPSTEKSVPQLAGSKKSKEEAKAEPVAKVQADPELQKRIEEEEAKKRKRAERFGNASAAAQPEKKQKTDEGAVAA